MYRNLNNKKLSVLQGNRIVAYAESIYLKDVTFIVQKSGLERCRREMRKNVHAYVKGVITDEQQINGLRINYCPYKYGTFVDENEQPIHSVGVLFIGCDGKMIGNN